MEIQSIVEKQKNFYNTNKTKEIKYRIKYLKKLKESIIENENKINEALMKDLNKSPYETYMTEVGIVLNEITHVLKNIKKWSKTQKVKTSISNFKAKSFIIPESYGTVLIIAPWNYPFLLSIEPMISAIAAGNTVIIKPSEYAINTSKIIKKIINSVFESEYVEVVEGGIKESEELLNQKFDYIFYTGSTNVGKIVMEKASKNLTPVTLELGGKSPCIIDETANIKLSAKRIVFGKILNAGQTCVAPDYVLVHEKVKDELIKYSIEYIKEFLGAEPLKNNDYPKIINEKHFYRLQELMKDEKIAYGGKVDKVTKKIEPTLIENVNLDSKIMKEEIFGPLLPIITFKELSEIKLWIKEKPLALYLFTNNKKIENKILKEISFGGGCVNDTIMHLASTTLPFGGVAESGMGAYHGKFGFDTFTHYKGILKKSNKIDIKIRYHKYTKQKLNIIKKIMK